VRGCGDGGRERPGGETDREAGEHNRPSPRGGDLPRVRSAGATAHAPILARPGDMRKGGGPGPGRACRGW
jgi:hypothetical protein